MSEKQICEQCNGDGWYIDRNPKNPYGDPIQVQCEVCYGEGHFKEADE